MRESISGKEALIALANGECVEYTNSCTPSWHELSVSGISINEIISPKFNKFRLKPRTITINGIEVPKPIEITNGMASPKWECLNIEGSTYWFETAVQKQQVVAALREVFK